jgi:hypothetical protein
LPFLTFFVTFLVKQKSKRESLGSVKGLVGGGTPTKGEIAWVSKGRLVGAEHQPKVKILMDVLFVSPLRGFYRVYSVSIYCHIIPSGLKILTTKVRHYKCRTASYKCRTAS